MRCLIANDIDFVLNGYHIVLKQYFELVDCAENGLAAFDLVKSHSIDFYDYIFLDINMPIMNGVEACAAISRYLREKTLKNLISVSDQSFRSHKRPKIIAVTADIRKDQIAKLYKNNFTKVINCINHENVERLFEKNHKNAGIVFNSVEPKSKKNPKIEALNELY